MQIIAGFFRWIWQLLNFIRNLLMNLFFIFLVLISIEHWMHIKNDTQAQYSEHGAALLLDINGEIVDKPSTSSQIGVISRQLFDVTSDRFQENSLFDIVDAIRQAKEDHNISGIVLDLKNFTGADQPSMQYIGKALIEFRDSGKPVIAIGDNYNQGQYYLASFADKIWLSPYGRIDLHGFSTNHLYYKSLLDKLKVTTHVFRIGTYKSAVEPFIRNDMSPEIRQIENHWIRELWHNYLSTISTNRKISMKKAFPGAKNILDCLRNMDGDTARYALHSKLVDALGSRYEIENALSKQFGWNEKNKNYRTISIYNYTGNKSSDINDTIAVIFVNGIIMDGKGAPGNTGSDTLSKEIRSARLNPNVKAIVLRVNSPGGSVIASEIIREEIATARAVGKPVVVSMGGIGASGAYWISTAANYIMANPSTLTGSIGVFGIINTMENSLDYLGIHTDGVSTSPLSDVILTKSLPSEVSQMIQLSIEKTYKRFINLVAQSRKKTPEQIDKVAQGHVWTGSDAKNNGLIDRIGDFDDAIEKAAELAKMKHWHINYSQRNLNFLDKIINSIFSSIRMVLSESMIKTSYFPLPIARIAQDVKAEEDKLTFFNDPKKSYAFCFSCTNVLR